MWVSNQDGKAATCTEAGLEPTQICSKCGKTSLEVFGTAQKVIPALGHDYGSSSTIVREPTPTTEGLREQHCSRCGNVLQTAIPVCDPDGRYLSDIATLATDGRGLVPTGLSATLEGSSDVSTFVLDGLDAAQAQPGKYWADMYELCFNTGVYDQVYVSVNGSSDKLYPSATTLRVGFDNGTWNITWPSKAEGKYGGIIDRVKEKGKEATVTVTYYWWSRNGDNSITCVKSQPSAPLPVTMK